MRNTHCLILVLMFLSCQGVIAQADAEQKVDSLLALSKEYDKSGSLKKAQSLQQTAEKLILENFGKESRPWASALVNRARISDSEKDTARTISYLNESIALFGRLGVIHKDWGIAYNNLGVQYRKNLKDHKTAEVCFRKALNMCKQALGDGNHLYFNTKRNLGLVLSYLANYEEAVTCFEKCVEFYETDIEKNLNSFLESVDNLADNYYNLGRYTEAESVYLKGKATREKTSQTQSSEYAENLKSLGNIYYYIYEGCEEEAESFYLEAREIYKKNLNNNSEEYVSCLIFLADCNDYLKRYDKAKTFLLEYKSVIIKLYGSKSAEYAKCIRRFGSHYETTLRFDEALELYKESASILENNRLQNDPNYARYLYDIAYVYNLLGKTEASIAKCLECITVCTTNPDKNGVRLYYADCLALLGKIYLDKNQLPRATALLEEACENFSLDMGRENSSYIQSRINLANAYKYSGRYDEAQSLYQEIKLLYSKNKGLLIDYGYFVHEFSDFYLSTGRIFEAEQVYLEALAYEDEYSESQSIDLFASAGAFYTNLGKYNDAESILLKAKELISSHIGNETDSDAYALKRLGFLYGDMGRYSDAISLLEHALSIYGKNSGVKSANYAECMGVLASVYRVNNKKKAENLFLEAKSIMERNGLTQTKYYNSILENFAIFYNYSERYLEAEQLYMESKKSFKSDSEKNTSGYADLLNNIGGLYWAMGKCDEAEELFKEVKSIREVTTNRESTDYIKCITNLSGLYYAQDRFDIAREMKDSTVMLVHQVLSESVFFSSEKDMLEQTDRFIGFIEDIPSYLHTGKGSDRMACLAYDDALFQKGFVQTVARRLNLLSSATPEVDSINRQLKSCRYVLSKEYTKPLDERKNVAQLETKATELERQLARKVSGYAEAIRQVKWQQIQSALKPGEAAIEFIRFQVLLPEEKDSFMYAALVVKPGLVAPEYIALCEEKELDELLLKGGARKQDYVGQLYNIKDRSIVTGGKKKNISLHKLLWKPLEKSLQGIDKIYYSNAGLMHRINLSAIPVSPDSTLADRYRLVQLGSTRSLVQPGKVEKPNTNAVVMGGIMYDADSTALQTSIQQLDSFSYATRGELRFSRPDSTEAYTEFWDPLPYTAKEATDIAESLKKFGYITKNISGYDATEEAFHKLNSTGASPRVLHIATHGFFLPNPEESRKGKEKNVYKQSDNPLIRSGLVLAGGNHAWNTGKSVKTGLEDGILTAYEISQTNLSNTELVVLSACETGLGDIQGNEGVYGLQRAFKIAGAKYLIMSLWQVPDLQTSAFMTQFYKNWLEKRMTIPDAFRQTQQEMRQRFLDPFGWAGFVLIE